MPAELVALIGESISTPVGREANLGRRHGAAKPRECEMINRLEQGDLCEMINREEPGNPVSDQGTG